MSPVTRRIVAYWLLLLVATLVAGGGGMLLLKREEARLAEQRADTTAARRAALVARAGLVAENVELIVGDMQAGLLETLATFPADGLNETLADWQRANPLVRTAFRTLPDGTILHPARTAADEEAQGFRRRFGLILSESAPWLAKDAPVKAKAFAESELATQSNEADFARQQVFSNRERTQSARRDARETSKISNYSRPAETQLYADAGPQAAAAPSVSSLSADKKLAEGKRTKALLDDALLAKAVAEPAAPGRSGWATGNAAGRPYLLGWVEMPAAGEFRGVEVELAALIARLAGGLPAVTGTGEGYLLRDERGRVMHQAGRVPADGGEPVVRLPVAEGALPGWEVAAFLESPPDESADGGSGFFLFGSLLAATLGVAILAGGSLLLWQARRSEAEAAQKTSFVANVSHEFKTPLTTIRLYAELLEQGRVAGEDKRTDYLRTIGRETQRLARLVGNALEFSRLEQGKKKFERVSLDAAAALGRLLDTHVPRLAEAGLRVERKLPGGSVMLTTDADALEQIVLNLLDNAAKYAASGGEVTVELLPGAGHGARVRVLDRGPGVPADHRERIFEKFHRVDDALTAEQTGTGLGLSIARQLARGLGGDLHCEPREGGGAAFILDLP
ncbi:HAMP domain-containing histidine kinase [Oleiharenicola lentus]|uniref:histidine kinase n=1 Tax=Oleiharenicola lentus TaxID=2508720 RepID=A0A4Q1C9E5_9BACT|nr:HAMP domain-containing sensor histidine kinase [Oleiharenicola lentus]RXK55568.1 HAMP domain-containing histidine kinase [Oleiharenicola lentus]